MYKVLDLFSGIGGFSLGLERTGGFQTVAFCEIDPFCRKVLKKHWPEVPQYHDVRELTAERLAADGISIDVICGGFPCQDISVAGKGAGLAGERSGLWSEIARLASELRPQFLIVENVSALLSRGLDRVLGDLAEIGLDAEWHCIPASAVGAPHRRDRFWLVAYPDKHRCRDAGEGANGHKGNASTRFSPLRQSGLRPARSTDVADTNSAGWVEQWRPLPIQTEQFIAECGSETLADAPGNPSDGLGQTGAARSGLAPGGRGCERYADQWRVEPDVGRVAYGVPSRVDRLRALGNAVVPQIPEMIGRAILAAERDVTAS